MFNAHLGAFFIENNSKISMKSQTILHKFVL